MTVKDYQVEAAQFALQNADFYLPAKTRIRIALEAAAAAPPVEIVVTEEMEKAGAKAARPILENPTYSAYKTRNAVTAAYRDMRPLEPRPAATVRDELDALYRAYARGTTPEWSMGPKLYTRNSMTANSYHVANERSGKERRLCGWGYSTGTPKSHIEALARADRRNKTWADRRKATS